MASKINFPILMFYVQRGHGGQHVWSNKLIGNGFSRFCYSQVSVTLFLLEYCLCVVTKLFFLKSGYI